ncbi:armadillo-type protein [Catenaria anguillulae PL171]|uniref:Importin-95 n=1 Tax=Catenaria anguillulae PL171 TaxID=765915 RepID=A0A1Y2HYI9_9FUNG|nr:armadillo-type protein [Catenaria anguillulae PL171]
MSVAEWLAGTFNPDHNIRAQAEAQLAAAAEANFTTYIGQLTEQLVNKQVDSGVRTAAGLAFKNAITATDSTLKEAKLAKWRATDATFRSQVKAAVLSSLDSNVNVQVAQVIAAIAAVELPRSEWPELIPALLGNMTATGSSEVLKAGSMTAIGFTCEIIDPKHLAQYSDQILMAVMNGARKEEPSQVVRVKALEALLNSLTFIQENFARDNERNVIMQVLCEGTQTNNTEVQVAAYQCLIRIVDIYYRYMELYMRKALFGVTIFSMQSENDAVVLQAIEFWSTLCEREYNILVEMEEAEALHQLAPERCMHFARDVLKELVPVLFWLMTKQDEDADEDEWNTAMAAATCLGTLASTVGTDIVPNALPFIENNLRSVDWHYREAAVMTFGSILEGPDPAHLVNLVNQALPYLLAVTTDEHPLVRDSAAWTLGRVCEFVLEHLSEEAAMQIVEALVRGLGQSEARIIASSSWALCQFAAQYEHLGGEGEPTSPLSKPFAQVTQALLMAASVDAGALSLRMGAYQALVSWMAAGADDTLNTTAAIADEVLKRLEVFAGHQAYSAPAAETVSNLVAVINTFVRRVGKSSFMLTFADRIMAVLLRLFSVAAASKATGVIEDILYCIGGMAQVLEMDFGRFVEAVIPVIVAGLQAPDEHAMCLASVGAVADLARATDRQFVQISSGFMDYLGRALTHQGVHPSLPPAIITCFGDIAMAIGGKAFGQYLGTVMSVLKQAAHAAQVMSQSDVNSGEFLENLHESIIEALVGIVNALATDGMVTELTSDLEFIAQMCLETLQTRIPQQGNDVLMRNVVGLVGDIVQEFDAAAKPYFGHSAIEQLCNRVYQTRSLTTNTRQTARWARDLVRKLL